MSAINVRLPKSLHQAVRELAKEDEVSINQFITLAIAEKVSAIMTENYIAQRGSRGTRLKFDEAMAQVPDVPADDFDTL